MKIYLAAGMTVTNVKGRERELANKWKGRDWRRLFSFYWKECIEISEIFTLVKEANNEIIPSSNCSGE